MVIKIVVYIYNTFVMHLQTVDVSANFALFIFLLFTALPVKLEIDQWNILKKWKAILSFLLEKY
jgi:hypothetical protein